MFTVIKKRNSWRKAGCGAGEGGRWGNRHKLHICPCGVWVPFPPCPGLFRIFGVRCQQDLIFLGKDSVIGTRTRASSRCGVGEGERMKPPRTRSLPTSGSRGCGAPWPREPSHAPAAHRRGTASALPRSWHSGWDRAEAPRLEASTSPVAGAGSGSDSRGAYRGVREAVTEWAGAAGMPGDPRQTGACRNPVGVRGARAGIGEGRDTNRPCREARTEMHYGHTEPEAPRLTWRGSNSGTDRGAESPPEKQEWRQETQPRELSKGPWHSINTLCDARTDENTGAHSSQRHERLGGREGQRGQPDLCAQRACWLKQPSGALWW